MNPLAKAIRANGRRITRFHTERGELMPLTAWLRVPQALWTRVTPGGNNTPWMVPSAVSHLARIMRNDWNVFEFGSGWSTLWYAERSDKVTSVEDDPHWHALVREKVRERAIVNCDARLVDLKAFAKCVEGFENETFDLVIVDGSEEADGNRLICIQASAPKVKQGGYLVLDDSDRAAYREADRLLKGWTVRRFVGVKPCPLTAVETSVYRRPLDSQAGGDGHEVKR
jgi:hypothetical protein